MAELNTTGGHGHRKARGTKLSTRVDLTPMVDLGFLLITFFLFTTTLAKPRVMQMSMPYRPEDPAVTTAWKDGQTMTLVLSGNHRIYYYTGMIDGLGKAPEVKVSGFQPNGIREVIIGQIKAVKKLQQQGVFECWQ